MSINDRIKVLWKTNCEWRDKHHFPKRRDFQLREGELEGSLLPLNVGDAAKIKFEIKRDLPESSSLIVIL